MNIRFQSIEGYTYGKQHGDLKHRPVPIGVDGIRAVASHLIRKFTNKDTDGTDGRKRSPKKASEKS